MFIFLFLCEFAYFLVCLFAYLLFGGFKNGGEGQTGYRLKNGSLTFIFLTGNPKKGVRTLFYVAVLTQVRNHT